MTFHLLGHLLITCVSLGVFSRLPIFGKYNLGFMCAILEILFFMGVS